MASVTETGIPNEVRDFISEHIASMEQIEVLLLLSSHPDTEWTVDAVYAQIQSSPTSIHSRLREFCDKGLAIEKSPQVFQYHPRTENVDRAVRALAATYKERRIKVIEYIYKKPADDVQSFADAFKFRKDKPNA